MSTTSHHARSIVAVALSFLAGAAPGGSDRGQPVDATVFDYDADAPLSE